MSISPIIAWSCSDVATALTAINHLTGLTTTGGTDTLDFMFTKKQLLATRASSTNHTRARTLDALTVLEEISATQGEHAVARFRTTCIYDGTNEPLIFAGSIALAANTSNLVQKYKLGQVQVNGSAVDGITGWTYRPNIEVETVMAGGSHRPSFAAVRQRQPTLEYTTLEIPHMTSLTPDGAKGTTAFAFYLQKMDEYGDVVAANTAEHVKLTCQANHYRLDPGAITVRNNDNATFTVTVRPMHDGTNDEVSVNTASAIT
jgi:hypothetical protein